MMNTIDTKFAPRHAHDIDNDIVIRAAHMKKKLERKKINMAKSLNSFGGKRFLGLTPKGKRVFASYVINDDLTLSISFTHKLSVLLEEGAKFAGRRYTWPLNAKIMETDEQLTRKQKIKSGEVTVKTLHWLQRLKNLADGKYSKAFYKNKVTKSFFTKVAMAIFTGTNQENDMDHWTIRKAWAFPEHNPYFNIEQTYKYPDEL